MRNRWSSIAITALLALTTVRAVAQEKVDVTGKWLFQVETGAGSGTPTMEFKQDGEKLTGHYSGQLGEGDIKGTVKGNAIEFTFVSEAPGLGFSLQSSYKGTIDKDTMKGTVSITVLNTEGTFTAKRQ